MKNSIEAYSLGLVHMVVTIILSGLLLTVSAFTGMSFTVSLIGHVDLFIIFIIAASTIASLHILKSRLSKCNHVGRILFGALVVPFFAAILELYVLYSAPTLTDVFSFLGPLSAYVLVTVGYLVYLSKTKSI